MYFHLTIEPDQNNLHDQDCSPTGATQQEDLLFLANTLQEHLRAEVPSGEFFSVQCAVKNDKLMILTQHPKGVWPDTKRVFVVLEETLLSLSLRQSVELFLRVLGEKLPYALYFITLAGGKDGEAEGEELASVVLQQQQSHHPSTLSSLTLSADPIEGEGGTFFSIPSSSSSLRTPRASPLLSVALVLMTVLGSGAYFLTCPCVMFACPELQSAKQLQRSFKQRIFSRNSDAEFANWQQQFNSTNSLLKRIPWWSPYYDESDKISESLSRELEKINHLKTAFHVASLAVQRGQTAADSLEELQDRQQMWRRAIALLEAIHSHSPFYNLAQQKIELYRTNLQTVKHLLITEEKWLKKLETAKTFATTASWRESSIKSLEDLQRIQSDWLFVFKALTAIPQTSFTYKEAQKLLEEYQPSMAAVRDRTTIELLAHKTYNQAVNTAKLAKIYEQQNQWQAAVTHWSLALNGAKQVPQNSLTYTQAQTLITPYSTALKQAEEQLQVGASLQKTRSDLTQTCVGKIRVCNFIVNNRGITVWITPEYQQIFTSSLMNPNQQRDPKTVATVTKHLQVLQQALIVISENANLPLVVYGIQG